MNHDLVPKSNNTKVSRHCCRIAICLSHANIMVVTNIIPKIMISRRKMIKVIYCSAAIILTPSFVIFAVFKVNYYAKGNIKLLCIVKKIRLCVGLISPVQTNWILYTHYMAIFFLCKDT